MEIFKERKTDHRLEIVVKKEGIATWTAALSPRAIPGLMSSECLANREAIHKRDTNHFKAVKTQ